MDADQDGVGLLAQGVALEQSIGRRARPEDITGREPSLGDDRKGILEPVGQPLALGREAVVPQPHPPLPQREPGRPPRQPSPALRR